MRGGQGTCNMHCKEPGVAQLNKSLPLSPTDIPRAESGMQLKSHLSRIEGSRIFITFFNDAAEVSGS